MNFRARTFAAALALGVVAALPATADAQLRDGFRSTLVPRGDDTVTPFAAFGFAANIRGGSYDAGSACMNGYISLLVPFDASACLYPGQSGTPQTLSFLSEVHGTAVAGLYRDLDSRNSASGQLGWGAGTVDGRQAFGFTWDGIFSWGTQNRNFFQVLFIDRAADFAAGDFDLEFNYGALAGGTELTAGVGEDGSFTGTPYTVGVTPTANSRSVLCFRSGTANNALCQAPTNVVPEPSTYAMLAAGLATLGGIVVRRRRTAA